MYLHRMSQPNATAGLHQKVVLIMQTKTKLHHSLLCMAPIELQQQQKMVRLFCGNAGLIQYFAQMAH